MRPKRSRNDQFRNIRSKSGRYGLRNNAEGLCFYCFQPLAHDSLRLCVKHRDRSRQASAVARQRPEHKEEHAAYMQLYRGLENRERL